MRLSSWKIEGVLPKDKKLVICVAPHTSNWDFFIGKIAYGSLGKKTSFLIKKEWVDNILVGWWLKLHGAIGVARDKRTAKQFRTGKRTDTRTKQKTFPQKQTQID